MVERFLEVKDCEKKKGEDICKLPYAYLKNITLVSADTEDRAMIMAQIGPEKKPREIILEKNPQ